jgi:hypothetical protein
MAFLNKIIERNISGKKVLGLFMLTNDLSISIRSLLLRSNGVFFKENK